MPPAPDPSGLGPFFIPDFPERAVKFSERGPVVHHAPGTYARDLPGLDHEFELVFSDASAMWAWRVRDFEGCYDALRVHMGELPGDVGLRRLEFRLADPRSFDDFGKAIDNWVWVGADGFDSPFVNQAAIPWAAYPNWKPDDISHPDWATVSYGCHPQPAGRSLCDIMPE